MPGIHISFRRFSNSVYHSTSTVVLVLFISSIRMIMELSIQSVPSYTLFSIFLDFFTFYFTMFFLFSFILSFITERKFDKIANFSNVGLLLGVFPPIIDFSLYQNTRLVNYKYFSQLNWLLIEKDQAIGESITLWILIFLTGFISYQLTKSYLKLFLGIFFSYTCIQLLSLVMILTERYPIVHNYEITAGLSFCILSFIAYISLRYDALLPSIFRFMHGLPHFFLVLIGSSFSGNGIINGLDRAFLVLSLVFIMIIHNDFYDKIEDKGRIIKENLAEYDVNILLIFAILFIIHFFTVYPLLPFVAGVFFLASYLYHHPVFRLKERFCLSYKIEGTWALFAFLIGLQTSGGFPVNVPLFWISIFIFGGGTLLSIPKDYKDTEADRLAKIPSYYVIFLEKGYTETSIHRVICLSVFLGLLVPVFYLLYLGVSIYLILVLVLISLLSVGFLLYISSKKLAVKMYLISLSAYLFLLAVSISS